jgi:hypothetical protein
LTYCIILACLLNIRLNWFWSLIASIWYSWNLCLDTSSILLFAFLWCFLQLLHVLILIRLLLALLGILLLTLVFNLCLFLTFFLNKFFSLSRRRLLAYNIDLLVWNAINIILDGYSLIDYRSRVFIVYLYLLYFFKLHLFFYLLF